MNESQQQLIERIDMSPHDMLVKILKSIVTRADEDQVNILTSIFDEHMRFSVPPNNRKKRKVTFDMPVSSSTLQMLSEDVIESQIFPFLNLEDHCRMAATCHYAYKIAGCVPPRKFYINQSAWNKHVQVRGNISMTAFAKLIGFAATRSLELTNCFNLSDSSMHELRNMQWLEDLRITGTNVSDDTLEIISKLPIRSLYVNTPRVTDFGLSYLKKMPLKSLSLVGCNEIIGWGLRNWRGMPLETLVLSLPHFCEGFFRCLAELPLSKLDLRGCGHIGMFDLLADIDLKELHVDACRFTGRTLPYLVNMPLQELTFYDEWCVDEGQLNVLSQMTSVRTMNLANFGCITDSSLADIKPMKLENLDLSYCQNITDIGLGHLRSHPLRKLCLNGCGNVTDEGLSFLAGMEFEELELIGTQISDKGLSFIRSQKLESLKFGSANITNAGLIDHFIRDIFPNLKSLILNGIELIK